MFKIVQKQTYTVLSHRYSVLLIFTGIVFVLVSAFQFGEVAMEWSRDQYSALFNIYHDNIAGVAYQNRMCLPIPIDAVYTWVNGSDPKLAAGLRKVKWQLELQQNHTSSSESPSNKTSAIQCKQQDCLPVKLVVMDTGLPASVNLQQLSEAHPAFLQASRIFNVTKDAGAVHSVVEFNKNEEVDKLLSHIQIVFLGNKNITLSRGYLTSDWTATNSVSMKELILVTGITKDVDEDTIRNAVPEEQRQHISKIDIDVIAGMAILTLSNTDAAKGIISQGDRPEAGEGLWFMSSYLIWGLEQEVPAEGEVSANRFQDNEELRYSLRSLEKHAPWIRHVYIVTNGQIPSWLNLDNPRMTLVSHEELFVNKSHLPTFSSPAIESHLHRIPGLSKKFIYLNDDTMFGKEVWPDDFYTHARGQKVYLTWPVPNCAEGCPSSWIRDNYCDKACNTSECDWDGGDCDASRTGGDTAQGDQAGGTYLEQMYCNSGCANGWVADKYCDQACNVQSCGFDAGDCGTVNFHRLHSEKILGPTEVSLPRGLTVAFFNVSSIFTPNGSITEGRYANNKAVRTATVAQKFFTVHLLLYKNISESVVSFTIEGKKDDVPVNVTFNVTVNTLPVEETAVSVLNEDTGDMKDKAVNQTKVTSVEETFLFENIDEMLRGPHKPLKPLDDKTGDVDIPMPDFIPDDVAAKLKQLDEQLEQGDLTEKGFKKQKTKIIKDYRKSPDYKTRRDADLKSNLLNNDQDPNMGQEAPNMDQVVPNMGQAQMGQLPNMDQQAPNMKQQKLVEASKENIDLNRIMSARKRAEEREKGFHKQQHIPNMGNELPNTDQQVPNMGLNNNIRMQGNGVNQPVGQNQQVIGQGMGQQVPVMGQEGQYMGQQIGDTGQGQGVRQQVPGHIGEKFAGLGQNMGQPIQNMGQQIGGVGQQVLNQMGQVPGQMGQVPGMGQQQGQNMGQPIQNMPMGQQIGGVGQQVPNQMGQVPGQMGQQLPNAGQLPLMGQMGQQVPGMDQGQLGQVPLGGQNLRQGTQIGAQIGNGFQQNQFAGQQLDVRKDTGQRIVPGQKQAGAGQIPIVGQMDQKLQNLNARAGIGLNNDLPKLKPIEGQQLPNMGQQLPNMGNQLPNMDQQAPNMAEQIPNMGQQNLNNNMDNAIPGINQGDGAQQPQAVPNNFINPNVVLGDDTAQKDDGNDEQREGKIERQKRDAIVAIEDDNVNQRDDGDDEVAVDIVANQQARMADMNLFYNKKKEDDNDEDTLLKRRLLSVAQNVVDDSTYNVSKSDYGVPFREHFEFQSQTSNIPVDKYNKPSSTNVDNSFKHGAKFGKFETMRITEGYEGESIKKKMLDVTRTKSSKSKMDEVQVETVKRREDVLPEELNEQQELERREEKEKFSRLTSFLPWERDDILYNITQMLSMKTTESAYETHNPPQRRLLDAFRDSLHYTNKLYNNKFGFTSRKVPAHMPHMIDVDIMKELQQEFADEFDLTSSHPVRHSLDMQFAFSYMYYIIGAPKEFNVTEVFDEFDTDGSGILSDREIRTLATRLYDLPLDLKTLTNLENIIINCSKHLPRDGVGEAMVTEKYYEEKMPQVSKWLVGHCDPLIQLMGQSVEGQTKYRHEIMGDDEVAFKMIHTNVSQVIGQLDDVRKNPKKFVCLNDNIDHSSEDSSMVKAVIQDFYESLFPIASQFELSREYRNRFLHIDELREWRRYRDWLRFWTHLSLGGLIVFSIASFCSTQLRALKRRCCPRRRVRSHDIAEKVQHV